MPKSTVTRTESTIETDDGERNVVQYRTTVPLQIAEFFDLTGGEELDWGMGSSRNKIELEILEGGDSGDEE